MKPNDPRHGTPRGFYAGCRELCCRRARARHEKEGRLARLSGGRAVPALGSQRRIQALMALGWTSDDIANACGWNHRNSVLRILHGQKGKPCNWLLRKTAQTVADVFEQLCMVRPDDTPYRKRARSLAVRKGYLPPLAWDDIDDPKDTGSNFYKNGTETGSPKDYIDLVTVERILAGEGNLPASLAEKREVVRRWTRSHAELARLTGWKVERYVDRSGGGTGDRHHVSNKEGAA